jgi:hypothetical protein
MVKFVKFLLFFIIFQTLLAVFTQFFGIFYFWVIFVPNLLAVLVIVFLFFKNYKIIKFKNFRIDRVAFAVVIISAVTLYQVHYNYTGKYSMVNDVLFQYHEVKNMQYVYPYFSDEWYAVALVKESIKNHSLPLNNPFDSSFFPNLEMFFHSFIAEIMMLFGFDPLTQYTALSVFINTLIILLAYCFLRINNVSKLTSAISSLSILYITCGSNLPGIWNLIPITMGIVLSLIGFCFLSAFDFKMAVLSFVFGALFYPPLIIFYAVALPVYLFSCSKKYVSNN